MKNYSNADLRHNYQFNRTCAVEIHCTGYNVIQQLYHLSPEIRSSGGIDSIILTTVVIAADDIAYVPRAMLYFIT